MRVCNKSRISDNLKDLVMADRNVWVVKITHSCSNSYYTYDTLISPPKNVVVYTILIVADV